MEDMPKMLWKLRREHLKFALKNCTRLYLYKHDFCALITEFNHGMDKKIMYSSKHFLKDKIFQNSVL